MWQRLKDRYEASLMQGISGWAWPISVLVAGLEMDAVIRVLIWLSQFTLPHGVVVTNLF